MLRWLTLTYDLALIGAAIFDAWNSKLPTRVGIERHLAVALRVGAETEVRIENRQHTPRDISLIHQRRISVADETIRRTRSSRRC